MCLLRSVAYYLLFTYFFTGSGSLYIKSPTCLPTFFFVTATQSMVTEGAQKQNYLILKKNKSLTWWVHGEAVTYILYHVNNESVCSPLKKEYTQTLQANKTVVNNTAFLSHSSPCPEKNYSKERKTFW